MKPRCCGQDAQWTVISPTLQYWYCKECKNEVDDTNPLLTAQTMSTDEQALSYLEELAKKFDSGIYTIEHSVPKGTYASPIPIARTKKDVKEAADAAAAEAERLIRDDIF